jgi:N-acetylmuramoyl-L-alanine amidase
VRAALRLACSLTLLVGSCWSTLDADPAATPHPLAGKIIVLDPGHAVMNDEGKLINPGAHGRHNVQERDVVLSVAEKLAPLLEAQGAKVYMTRTQGNPWRYSNGKHSDNRARAIFANVMRADAYVRLHCDWNRNKRFKGFTVYYFRWGSRNLAKYLRRALGQALPGHKDNGIHRRTFVSVTARMPAVLLEFGVLSNRQEVKDLANDNYQTRLAQATSTGLVDYFEHIGPHESAAPPVVAASSSTKTN